MAHFRKLLRSSTSSFEERIAPASHHVQHPHTPRPTPYRQPPKMVVYYKIAGQSIGSHWVRFSTPSFALPSECRFTLSGFHSLCVYVRTTETKANASVLQLSIATLTTAFAGGYLSTGGSKKKEGGQGPPINAKDQDEEKFIQYVMHIKIS